MRQDGRLVRMMHVLVHMGLLGGRETSATIAAMLNTNPVVVRRTMGALRRAGIVASEGGKGGGWTLLRPLDRITVLDVRNALEADGVAPFFSHDHATCPVEQASNSALSIVYRDADELLRAGMARLTLAQIARDALRSEKP